MELLKSSNGMGIWKYNKYLLLNTESQKLSETTSIVRFAIIDIKPCKDLRELAADADCRCDAAAEKGRKRSAVGNLAWMKLKV